MSIDLRVEFSGGLELLFGNQRKHAVSLPTNVSPSSSAPIPVTNKPPDVTYLIHHLRTHVLTERPELFVDGDTVYVLFPFEHDDELMRGAGGQSRPGILVLINDTDWELEGEGAYVLQQGDEVVFISTLHGG